MGLRTDPYRTVDRNRHRRLDPRAPLVLDTRELSRRPGSLREMHRVVPAPPALGLELIGVPEGAPLVLKVRLEAVVEGVLVTARVAGPLVGECGRCLGEVREELEVTLAELYGYPGGEAAGDLAGQLDGDLLDLEPALRDAVVLALPWTPLCSPDCPGMCPDCGARLAGLAPLHPHLTNQP
ncbi:MAG: YceD family protein [Mycobacteriales bacterium]